MGKMFHVGDVLTITTGKIVSPSGMDGIYGILNYMSGDNLYTHQLGRVMEECEPYLLRQFPMLAGVDAGVVHDVPSRDAFLDTVSAIYGEMLEVEPMPMDDHTFKDPLTELLERHPGVPVMPIIVELENNGNERTAD